jgi:hypothetical protein
MYTSSFEKFKPVDDVLNAHPIHAKDYAEQMHELAPDTVSRMPAEAQLNLIALRLINHKKTIENHATCNLCKIEPIWIERIK